MSNHSNFVSILQEFQDELNLLYLCLLKRDDLKDFLPAHCYILHLLYENEKSSEKRNFKIINIAERLHKSKAVVSAVCKTLCEKKYINCIKDENDARAKNVFLTEKGFKDSEQIFNVWKKADEIIASGLTSDEQQKFKELLIKIINNSSKCRHQKADKIYNSSD